MNKRQRKKSNQDLRLDLLNIKLDALEAGFSLAAYQIDALEQAKSLQDEVIEKLGDDLAESKRQVAELKAILERNAQATNNRFDAVETYQKILEDNLKDLEKKVKKPFWRKK